MPFDLKQAALTTRWDFSLRVIAWMEIELKWLAPILCIDGAHFTLNVDVNTPNCSTLQKIPQNFG